MPKPSWENLDVFLQTDSNGGFAVIATVRFENSSERKITGIFDEPYLNAQLGEYDFDDSKPRFTCKEVDTLDVKRGDFLQFDDGRRFYVMGYPQPDGTGMVCLDLEIAND